MNKNLIDLDSSQAWIRLIIIFIMSVIGTAGMWSVVIIMPNIQSEFVLDRAASTYPYVATMFGYGIGNVIIGRMLDKIGITKPIIFALTLLVFSYLISTLANNVMWLSIIQFFLGFSAAAFFGPMMADISRFFYKRKGLAVSLVASGQHLCGAVWPFVIKDFLLDGEWREAHLFIALVCSIFIPILFYFLGEKSPNLKNDFSKIKKEENLKKKVKILENLNIYKSSKNYGEPFTFTSDSYDQFLLTTLKNVIIDNREVGFIAVTENANDVKAVINERKVFIVRTAILVGIVIIIFSLHIIGIINIKFLNYEKRI